MENFACGKWIWLPCGESADQYAEFSDSFSYSGGGSVQIRISVDSNYALWCNGTYIASGQYGDYEHYKIYDTLDLTDALVLGENRLEILAYHCGTPTSRYAPAAAGLLYEVSANGACLAASRAGVSCRPSPTYASGRCVLVSGQLGYTFFYDATREDETGAYAGAVEVEKNCTLFPRPIEKHRLLARREIRSIRQLGACRYLIDLGGEVVGLPTLDFCSPTEQTVTVAWGEHIEDGCVRREIGHRHFFFEYRARKGENRFTEFLLRLGCRYLEVTCEEPIELGYVGILPEVYGAVPHEVAIDDPLDRRIYEISLNTLRLCMMEHYVDCPWREQALYAFDSRNQMLFGYTAFQDKNAAYAASNLRLIAEDRREDGLLSICYPSGTPLAIFSFSLYYLLAVKEYTEATGDLSVARQTLTKLYGIVRRFLSDRRDGLACKPVGRDMWDFYDWIPLLSGSFGNTDPTPDLVLNALLLLALNALSSICRALGEPFPFSCEAAELRRALRSHFLLPSGCFGHTEGDPSLTVLGNALAILSGAAEKGEAKQICDAIVSGKMLDSTLSMSLIKYHALLLTDGPSYAPYVLREIRANYGKMIDAGSDTVWETLDGASAFSNAGSLCHGWSAVPIDIFHRLGIATVISERKYDHES